MSRNLCDNETMNVILDPLHPLQSSILEILGTTRSMTAKELHKVLTTQKRLRVSLKNLYRLLGRLIEEQVLSRRDGHLMLNKIWLSNLQGFLASASASRGDETAGSVDDELPRREGEQRTFIANSLSELDPTWNNLIGNIATTTSEKNWIFFNTHPWYSLGSPATEHRLFKGLAAHKIRLHATYGEQCFLDKYGATLVQVPGVKIKLLPSPPFRDPGYMLWICGDYVMELRLPHELVERFDMFFDNVKSISEFHPAAFADIFKMRARCTLNIKYSAKLARTLTTRIKPYLIRVGSTGTKLKIQ